MCVAITEKIETLRKETENCFSRVDKKSAIKKTFMQFVTKMKTWFLQSCVGLNLRSLSSFSYEFIFRVRGKV
jgi:hypothetical protein